MRYSAEERAAIARGEFFTAAELKARPGLGKSIVEQAARDAAARNGRVDPNTKPVSAQARKDAESPGVCAYCYEPGDDRSALVLQDDHYYRHPECQEAHDTERNAK